ncbi:MAG: penicillin-binding protein, partial [Clostridiales bacterium]|nr:penicillin-binding protein [Clostridiales bacterium]
NHGYGYQLWACTIEGAYRADGKYGQFSIVVPDMEAVITTTARNEENAQNILRSVWRDVLPRL